MDVARPNASTLCGAVLAIHAALAVPGLLAGCGDDRRVQGESCGPWAGPEAGLGATFDDAGCRLAVRVQSRAATRIEVWVYAEATGPEAMRVPMERGDDGVWSAELDRPQLDEAGVGDSVYYGFRAWGPNWIYDPDWEPGSSVGLKEDVDGDGNRFDPNKLLVDPYARELSHDPGASFDAYLSGPDDRDVDTGPGGPKGIVLPATSLPEWQRPDGAREDDVIYEVHVRGLTMSDPSVPADLRGTYEGAALKAPYLHDLGVTAIELLPVYETNNDYNGEINGMAGSNYWGYSSLSYFAPERRYAADRSPGGPTRELQDMVRAFHDQGIKVYIDVVYNHTAETGPWDDEGRTAPILSWRGLDDATYYELDASGRGFRNDNGVGPNVAVANPLVADMIVDSLRYWHQQLGVDGFRFDLAPIVGNSCPATCFQFDASDAGLLARIAREVPDAELIAEPWSLSSYQMGNFPAPWSEWNDHFRDTVRRHLNKGGVEAVTPRELAARWSGSPDRFADDGRSPGHSINYVVSHDGFTLRDLFSCNEKQNDQEWPYGPSPGGSDDNLSWDQGGDEVLQRQAARTAMALLMLSPGVPMMTGGDEFLRTQHCNNNAFNLDNDANWLDWQVAAGAEGRAFTSFVSALAAFRHAHPAIRPTVYWTFSDGDEDGQPDAAWLDDTGAVAGDAYLDDPSRRFLGLWLDGAELGDPSAALYIAYNGAAITVNATLPAPPPGAHWTLVADTSADRESSGNAGLHETATTPYAVVPRSLALFVAEAD